MKCFFVIWLWIFAASLLAASDAIQCPVCGMRFSAAAKTSFETNIDGKPIQVCSFACAHKLAHKHPEAKFFAHDFKTSEKVDADDAFFLTKSSALIKELEFNMPPTVVGFKSESDALLLKKKLGEGTVVKGWKQLKELYE